MAPRNAGTATNHSTGCVTNVAADPAATDRNAVRAPGRSTDAAVIGVPDAATASGSSSAHTGASTTSVSSIASRYDTSAATGIVGFVLAAAVALVLATTVPLDVVVLGILVVGAVHVALEVRYVYGRHPTILSGPLLVAANGVLVAIVAMRLVAGTSPSTARLEVLLLAGLVVAAALTRPAGAGPSARRRWVVVAAVVAGAAVAMAVPGSWFVVQAHLHNLIPLAFLWLWAAEIGDPTRRRRFRAVCVGWALVIPAVVLLGALDPVLGSGGSDAATSLAEGAAVTKGIAPPGLGSTWGARLLAAFAFAQVLHYATWCWFFPRHAPDATAAFEARPVGHHLRGLRLPLLAAVATVGVLVLALAEYRQGRTTYLSFASYHAYLEYPVLVAVAAGALATGAAPGKEPSQ